MRIRLLLRNILFKTTAGCEGSSLILAKKVIAEPHNAQHRGRNVGAQRRNGGPSREAAEPGAAC